jgi:hypothetical protein
VPGPLRLLLSCALLVAASARADEAPFAIQVIPSTGRTVTAELADVDGDGRQDLIHAVIYDLPPAERRLLRVHLQRPDGSIPATHDCEVEVPDQSAAYDVADVDGIRGADLLFLQPRGVTLLGFDRSEDGALAPRRRELRVPGEQTIGAAADERGLDRIRIASFAFGPEPWLIVPGIGEIFFLAPDGALRARIAGGARANYFIQPPGPMLAESDIQLYFDTPRISVGDVDGDGRPDIVASSRHELRTFLQDDAGGYPRVADATIPLGRVSLEDHIRGSGSVRSLARDLDGDGLVDLLLSLTIGGIMNASSITSIHLNRGGRWDLDRPDVTFETEKALSADQLIDLDGDRRLELVRIEVPISVLELVEIFVQSAIDARLTAFRIEPAAGATAVKPEPLLAVKLDIPIDFETSRPAGFVPTIEFDVNADGFVDYLSAADGKRLEVFLGSPDKGFVKRATQEFSTEGQIHGGDLNDDGLPDFVLFNSRRLDQPVLIVSNLGLLPGSPKRARLEAADE